MSDTETSLQGSCLRAAAITGLDLIALPGERADRQRRVVPPASAAEPMSQAWSVPAILVRAATGRLCRTEAYVRDRDRSFRTVLPQVRGGGVFAAAHAHQAERPADEALQRVENRNAVVTAWARAAQERARIAEARHAEDGSAQVQATILAAFPEAADRVAA